MIHSTSAPSIPLPGTEVRVLIADDHAMVRDGLRRILNGKPGLHVAGFAVDGPSTLERLRDTPCHVLLLDLTMPAPSGPELIRQIRGEWPELPILVLSMHNQPAVVRAVLQAGASGYVAKDNDPEILVQALRHVAGGGRYVEPRLAEALLFTPPPPPAPRLSPREALVLQRIAAGETNADIARSLFLSEKTISTHKTNLMSKLQITTLAELVRFVDEQLRTDRAGG